MSSLTAQPTSRTARVLAMILVFVFAIFSFLIFDFYFIFIILSNFYTVIASTFLALIWNFIDLALHNTLHQQGTI